MMLTKKKDPPPGQTTCLIQNTLLVTNPLLSDDGVEWCIPL